MRREDPTLLVRSVVDGDPGADRRLLAAVGQAEAGGPRADLLDPLADAAAGSGRALEVLLAAIHGEHLAMPAIHRFVVDRDDAEDVEQDVLINVARSIASFRGEARFTTWLHTVARNTAVDLLRRRRDAVGLEGEALTVAQRMSSVIATRATVRDAVAGLPPEYREPVVLRDLEHLPYQQIAERLGLNLNTTKSRIFRGRALLVGAVGDLDAIGPAASPGERSG